MDNLIKWYMNLDAYSEEESSLLKQPRKEFGKDNIFDDKYKALMQKYFDLMPFCNISAEDRFITFDESGTAFINMLFDNEVDSDTLVVSTTYEHGSVQNRLADIKNKILLDSDNDIRGYNIDKIIEEAKKYKKVFVYIIGTQLSTGEITPQLFFEELKKKLIENKIEHKILIDDVHGMFLTPRDYSIFDYVLYTAHSLVNEYDMGMLISKDGKYGRFTYDWADEYLKRLNIVLKRKEKMFLFKNLMLDYFNDFITDTLIFRKYLQTTSHIFAVETDGIFYTQEEYDTLDASKIRVSEHNIHKSWIRIRYQEFCRLSPDKAVSALHYLKTLLKKKIYIKKMREGL